MDWDDDVPFLPSLTVYDPPGGLMQPVGFIWLKEEAPIPKPQLELFPD